MPRIFDSGNDAHDFCKTCYPPELFAEKHLGDESKFGVGPDGRGMTQNILRMKERIMIVKFATRN